MNRSTSIALADRTSRHIMKNLILLCLTFVLSCLGEDSFVTIEINTDAHGDDISWVLEDLTSGVVIDSSAGTYGNNEVIAEVVPVDYGDYQFTIMDSIGDGLRVGGPGYYAIFDENDDEILRSRSGPFSSMTHVIRVGYDPEQDMTNRDIQWLAAHNSRRKAFHEDHDVSYVPLMWSNDLKDLAQDWLDHVLDDCDVEPIHAEPGIDEGENILGEEGIGVNPLDDPEEVLHHWVDQKVGEGYPANMPLTQVYWRSSKYVGCASGSQNYSDNTYCERHVCLYVVPGNCAMASFDASTGTNWMTPTLEEYSNCGYLCPSDGCYISSFDGLA